MFCTLDIIVYRIKVKNVNILLRTVFKFEAETGCVTLDCLKTFKYF